MLAVLLALALPALAGPSVPAHLLPQTALQDAAPLPGRAPLWTTADPGQLDPRQAGCATRTPGERPSPACQITLEQAYGPHAVLPASVTRAARD